MARDDKNEAGESKSQSDPRGHERAHSSRSERGRRESMSGRSAEESGEMAEQWSSESGSWLASAAVIGVGALIEPELLGGMLLGAGAVYASRSLPAIGGFMRPLMKSIVKVGYEAATKATELIAEATEDIQDMVAEVRSERQSQSHHSGLVVPSSEESF
jgi:hypothetical protein